MLRDCALACEAFGNIADAIRYWRAAIAADERLAATGDPAPDLDWLRLRLVHARSTFDRRRRTPSG
ncbi:hypothetical protein [Lichenicoccus sp.]|uniref:hypothetical protein n=1 Tax=Lichenicoccus sp. TaxID=2781899 RepID=UPI003D0EB888